MGTPNFNKPYQVVAADMLDEVIGHVLVFRDLSESGMTEYH